MYIYNQLHIKLYSNEFSLVLTGNSDFETWIEKYWDPWVCYDPILDIWGVKNMSKGIVIAKRYMCQKCNLKNNILIGQLSKHKNDMCLTCGSNMFPVLSVCYHLFKFKIFTYIPEIQNLLLNIIKYKPIDQAVIELCNNGLRKYNYQLLTTYA